MRLSPVFLLSATDVAHFPAEAKTFGAPEIAFLGRSNVGKSSLINSLLGSRAGSGVFDAGADAGDQLLCAA